MRWILLLSALAIGCTTSQVEPQADEEPEPKNHRVLATDLPKQTFLLQPVDRLDGVWFLVPGQGDLWDLRTISADGVDRTVLKDVPSSFEIGLRIERSGLTIIHPKKETEFRPFDGSPARTQSIPTSDILASREGVIWVLGRSPKGKKEFPILKCTPGQPPEQVGTVPVDYERAWPEVGGLQTAEGTLAMGDVYLEGKQRFRSLWLLAADRASVRHVIGDKSSLPMTHATVIGSAPYALADRPDGSGVILRCDGPKPIEVRANEDGIHQLRSAGRWLVFSESGASPSSPDARRLVVVDSRETTYLRRLSNDHQAWTVDESHVYELVGTSLRVYDLD